jgi:hypothetical protein
MIGVWLKRYLVWLLTKCGCQCSAASAHPDLDELKHLRITCNLCKMPSTGYRGRQAPPIKALLLITTAKSVHHKQLIVSILASRSHLFRRNLNYT